MMHLILISFPILFALCVVASLIIWLGEYAYKKLKRCSCGRRGCPLKGLHP